MKPKTLIAIGGCLAALLAQAALPHASAAPAVPQPPVIGTGSNRPAVFTLRYVAFVAKPKTKEVAALYKGFPPVLGQALTNNVYYAMKTTPESFIQSLQNEQPDHDFSVYLAGSALLYNGSVKPTQITDGPNPSDPYTLTIVDNITVRQNSPTTLDFVSEGTFSFLTQGSGDVGAKSGWNGENKELEIGRTYQWGASKKSDGTVVSWAFCILPGRLDQTASSWRRRNGAQEKSPVSDKVLVRGARQ